MKLTQTIGLIGVGNMGGAILEGLLTKKIAAPAQIWVYDKVTEKAAQFKSRCKVNLASSNEELVKQAEIVLLAVKPQDLQETAQELKVSDAFGPESVRHSLVLISILAGTPIAKIRAAFGEGPDIVRAMPNLAAKVAQAMTALCGTSDPALAIAETIFSGCGRTIRLEEKHFDLITALSGSGPAYFFYLMELMAKEGEARGLTHAQAQEVAIQTSLGAALLAVFAGESPEALREKVTSKGGTTEAALKELVKTFPQTFKDAIQAAYERGRELSE